MVHSSRVHLLYSKFCLLCFLALLQFPPIINLLFPIHLKLGNRRFVGVCQHNLFPVSGHLPYRFSIVPYCYDYTHIIKLCVCLDKATNVVKICIHIRNILLYQKF